MLSLISSVTAQKGMRGGATARVFTPITFTPIATPHSNFHTGGAYGAGDRIPMPFKWDKPVLAGEPNSHINHNNGFHTTFNGKGQPSTWLNMPGQYGPATCYTGCSN